MSSSAYSRTAPNPVHVSQAPAGAVEAEQARDGIRERSPACGAAERLLEDVPSGRTVAGHSQHDRRPVSLGERRRERVGHTLARCFVRDEPVHDDEQLGRRREIDLGRGCVFVLRVGEVGQVDFLAIRQHAHVALRADVRDGHVTRK